MWPAVQPRDNDHVRRGERPSNSPPARTAVSPRRGTGALSLDRMRTRSHPRPLADVAESTVDPSTAAREPGATAWRQRFGQPPTHPYVCHSDHIGRASPLASTAMDAIGHPDLLVGRNELLRHLDVLTGRCAGVLLVGEAGVGKSHLA